MSVKHSAILQELESDDELPDTYNDATILPAYLVDNRFDDIVFAWIDQVQSGAQTQPKPSDNNQKMHHYANISMNGILKHQDLYCLKSVETLTCSATLLWFANFLLHKDLQSHYKYLRSCLVNDLRSYVPFANKSNINEDNNQTSRRLEVIIKLL